MAKFDSSEVMKAVAELEHAHRQNLVVKSLMFLLHQLGITVPRHFKSDIDHLNQTNASMRRTLDLLGLCRKK